MSDTTLYRIDEERMAEIFNGRQAMDEWILEGVLVPVEPVEPFKHEKWCTAYTTAGRCNCTSETGAEIGGDE